MQTFSVVDRAGLWRINIEDGRRWIPSAAAATCFHIWSKANCGVPCLASDHTFNAFERSRCCGAILDYESIDWKGTSPFWTMWHYRQKIEPFQLKANHFPSININMRCRRANNGSYQLNSVYISALIKSFIYIHHHVPRHHLSRIHTESKKRNLHAVSFVATLFPLLEDDTRSARNYELKRCWGSGRHTPPILPNIFVRVRRWRQAMVVLFLIVLFVLLCDFFGKKIQAFMPQLPFVVIVNRQRKQ